MGEILNDSQKLVSSAPTTEGPHPEGTSRLDASVRFVFLYLLFPWRWTFVMVWLKDVLVSGPVCHLTG